MSNNKAEKREVSKCCGAYKISCLFVHTAPVCKYRFHCNECHESFEPVVEKCCEKCSDLSQSYKMLCVYTDCFCHSPKPDNKEEWKEEFDKLASVAIFPEAEEHIKNVLKSFVSNLLKSQREELVKEIEGMKNNTKFMSPTNLYAIQQTKGYQVALDSIIKLIREK